MAVACSSSLSQVTSLGRSLSTRETLRSCPQVGFAVSNGSRIVAMATKPAFQLPKLPVKKPEVKLPKLPIKKPDVKLPFKKPQVKLPKLPLKSPFKAEGRLSWLPGVKLGSLTDPEWLDGSLPGDYGFDPLGLGKDPAALKWFREAEVIHGRWALVAVVGIFVGQAWSGIPWFEAGADPGAVSPFSFGTLLGTQLLLMGWVETKRYIDFLQPGSQFVEWATPWSRTAENFGNSTGIQGYPGGKFFDPLTLAGDIKGGKYVTDYTKLNRLQTAEIKHCRIAMLAMLTFYFEAGQGFTPLGAVGLPGL